MERYARRAHRWTQARAEGRMEELYKVILFMGCWLTYKHTHTYILLSLCRPDRMSHVIKPHDFRNRSLKFQNYVFYNYSDDYLALYIYFKVRLPFLRLPIWIIHTSENERVLIIVHVAHAPRSYRRPPGNLPDNYAALNKTLIFDDRAKGCVTYGRHGGYQCVCAFYHPWRGVAVEPTNYGKFGPLQCKAQTCCPKTINVNERVERFPLHKIKNTRAYHCPHH